jgi:hypothetical protein
MNQLVLLSSLVLLFTFAIAGQNKNSSSKFSALLEKQLECKSELKAGHLLTELQKNGFTSKASYVVDSINYFGLLKPLKAWAFRPKAVFGWQEGYGKFFVRGPGTSPPEMIGIISSDSVAVTKAKLKRLGFEGLHVEESQFDLRGNINKSKRKFTEIACWRQNS